MPKPKPPAIEERQSRVFDLAIQGISAVAIAKLIGVNRATVARDIQSEAFRRGTERSADRAAHIERNIAALEKITADSNMRVRRLLTDAEASDSAYVAANLRGIVLREIHVQLKAHEQIGKVLGLFAPIAIDLTVSQEVEDLRARLWQAENNLRLRVIAEQREQLINGESDELPQC